MATEKQLWKSAVAARKHSISPHSNFAVGAALETDSGKLLRGCNIENVTFGLTVCAERVALWKGLSEGKSRFTRIAIVTAAATPTPPCGACRQLLWEFAGNIEILIGNLDGIQKRFHLADLFPEPFDAGNLGT
jgi:cytidine deaminase